MAKTKVVSRISYLVYRAKVWVKKNRLEAGILALILFVGAFFRIYKIDQYMTFLGDEGRDVIVVRRLLVDFDPILIGPRTSIGDMYLGPLYYYMMAPALFLANFSPAGPAVMIALLGVATIFFVWFIARSWFGNIAAVVTALLYAISPTVIIYSQSSWNPNIMPFFALISIYSVWQIWTKHKWEWLIVAGISMAFVLQSHYLGLLLIPTLSFFWLLTLIAIRGVRAEIRRFLKYSLISVSLFAFLMSPLIIFDARHGWNNFSAMKKFFTVRQTTVSARPWTALPKAWPLTEQFMTRLVASRNEMVGKSLTIAAAVIAAWLVLFHLKGLKKKELSAYFLIAVWLGVALIGLGVYKQHVYDHYYGFFFAAPFLLIGGISQHLIRFKKVSGTLLVVVATLVLVLASLGENHLKYPPNRQLQRTREVAQKMVDESGKEKFNIAVIAERNYEGAYQYFLERWKASFIIIDPQRYEETVTEQLFVVCELPVEKCDPTHNPKAEVANFGWSRIEEEWQVAGVTLFKLVHTQ